MVRVQVFSPDWQRRVGVVLASKHPSIRVGAVAFTILLAQFKVFVPAPLPAGGQLYRADYSPLRPGEQSRMHFIRRGYSGWFSQREDAPGPQRAVIVRRWATTAHRRRGKRGLFQEHKNISSLRPAAFVKMDPRQVAPKSARRPKQMRLIL